MEKKLRELRKKEKKRKNGIKKTKRKRICFIVIDGLNDLPIKELNNKTPLEIARTPNIDLLAAYGECGMLHLFDFAPESDEAMMALLNLNMKLYPGRGILETYNMKTEKNAVYFRCNIVKIENLEKNRIVDFEAKISEKLKKKIEKIVNKIDIGIDFDFKFTKGHRAVLVFKGKFSDVVSNTNPVYKKKLNGLSIALPRPKEKKFFIEKAKALNKSENSILTAKKLNEFTEKCIEALKQYKLAIVARGASKLDKLKKLEVFKNKWKDWILISEMPVEISIAKAIGMKIESYEKNYKKLAKKVAKLLESKNVYIQIKGPDTFSHRGDFIGKAKNIEKIDNQFFRVLLKTLFVLFSTCSKEKKLKEKKIFDELLMIITCDHITSSKHLSHYKGNLTYIKTNIKEMFENIENIEKEKMKRIYKKFCEAACKKKKIIKANELIL